VLCAPTPFANAIRRHPANAEIVAIDPFAQILHKIGINQRLGYSLRAFGGRSPLEEAPMVDPARRAKVLRELEQEFVPDYDALHMPSADKRSAYALEHIAFRVARIEQSLTRIAAAIEALVPKASQSSGSSM
jgi:hypothetical protein